MASGVLHLNEGTSNMVSIMSAARAWNRYSNHLLWGSRASTLPRTEEGKLMLHVGCGAIDAPGFVNIDARRMPHVHFSVKDLRDLSFVPPGCADLVYLSHILEHVPHPEVASVLKALYRITAPGGVLRLAVPDFDLILEIYRQTGCDIRAILGPLMGGQDYLQNFHFCVFNQNFLTNILQGCGFVDVHAWSPATADHHAFQDWSSRDFVHNGQGFQISLNLEASRPE
jgi:SAM-dependent methyltransferase